jgi:hypothetical protein
MRRWRKKSKLGALEESKACTMRKVVDNSMLQSIDLRRYLSASSSHFVVLPDFVAIESYKVSSTEEILKRWAIVSQFPEQALVLRSTSIVCGLRGRGRGLQARMIDHKQTAKFPRFCADLKRTQAGDARYQSALLKLSSAAQQEIATISAAVPRIMESRRQLACTYSEAEARAIRIRGKLPQSLKVKFVRNVCLLFWMLVRDHPRVRDLPKDFDDGCNLYLFRFALCVHIWLLEWIADGSNEQSNPSRLRNDLVDLHVAAYGTYFDGLMTGDEKMAHIHAIAQFVLMTMRAEPLQVASLETQALFDPNI